MTYDNVYRLLRLNSLNWNCFANSLRSCPCNLLSLPAGRQVSVMVEKSVGHFPQQAKHKTFDHKLINAQISNMDKGLNSSK